MSLAATHSIDLATNAERDGGLGIGKLEDFLSDMRTSPAFRARADLECDYYDSNQHTAEEISLAESRGLPIITNNMIAPSINMILGMEAKTRTDWKVLPDGPTVSQDYADALSVKLVEAERCTNADRACADAYASQIKAGWGWVQVRKQLDPFQYPYAVDNIDRREIWWDMRGTKDDTSDWRWLVRRKWHDADYLYALFPKMVGDRNIHDLIEAATSATAHWDASSFSNSIPMAMDGLIDRDIRSWEYDEWRDTERRRAMLYEVWYRVMVRGYTMKLPDGRVVEYDERNPVHQAIVAMNVAVPVSSVYSKVRLSWWLGPFRLYDIASPYAHNFFPYIPFFAYREDRTRVPYGQIRVMISPQDEINARRAKMLWGMSADRWTVREGAIADINRWRSEANRPDGVTVIAKTADNDKRELRQLIERDENTQMNAQQFEAYRDSKDTLQQAAGIYGPMLGDAKAGADAGVAIDMLISQGQTTLAEVNDNYRMSRTLVGEQLLSVVVQDMANVPTPVKLPDRHPRRPGETVMLNQPATTAEGLPFTQNDVTRLKTKVALQDVPQSSTYQQQEFKMLTDVIKGLPPELQPLVIDMWVESSSSPRKYEIAERIRKQVGIPGPAPDPASMDPVRLQRAIEEQASQQQQQQMQAIAQRLEMAAQQATIANVTADTSLKHSQALAALTKAGKIKGKITNVIAEPDMQGIATVDLKTPDPPKPTIGAKPGAERDSTSLSR